MATDQLQVILKGQGIAKENITQLLEAFGAPFEAAGEILKDYKTIVVTDVSQTDLMTKAREKRLNLKKTRVEVEHKRKQLKEESQKTGRAIDNVAAFVKQIIEPAEEYLEVQEKFRELKAAEEAAKRKSLRIEQLNKWVDEPSLYNYEFLDDKQFGELVDSLKTNYENKIEEAKKAEEERAAREKAYLLEQESIRVDNARLRAEAEAKESALALEREKAEQQRKVLEAQAAKERAEAQAKLEEERKAREAVEKIEVDRKAAESALLAQQEEVKRKALLAPDKEKLISFADVIERLELPNVANREAGKLLDETQDFLNRISKNLRNKAREL